MTIFEKAEAFPPAICRYLARKSNGHRPMSVRDIAIASGLSKSKVADLSLKTTWKGVSIDTVVAFSQACGVDLMRPHLVTEYLRKTKRIHLTRVSNVHQREFFQRLFKLRG
jgi:hypothetical protein